VSLGELPNAHKMTALLVCGGEIGKILYAFYYELFMINEEEIK
jgi:hypothetical protein